MTLQRETNEYKNQTDSLHSILAFRARQARNRRFQTESSGQRGRELDCEIDESEVSRF
jgi:hypothetical protein